MHPVIDVVVKFALILNAFFILAQVIKIYIEKRVAPFSLISYIGFSIFQLGAALHGFFLKDITLIAGMGASFLLNTIVVIQIILYKRPSYRSDDDSSSVQE